MWQQHPWVHRVTPGPSTGCRPHGGAGVSLQPLGTSPRCHRAPAHRGECAQPTPPCTGRRPLRFIKTHKSPLKLTWQRGSRRHGKAAGMCPPQPAASAPCSQHLHRWRSHTGQILRNTPRSCGTVQHLPVPPQDQPHAAGVADPIRTQPRPLGLRWPPRTWLGKGLSAGGSGQELGRDKKKKRQNRGKKKRSVLPSTLLRSPKTLCRGCTRNWLKVSFPPKKGAGAAAAIAWPPPQQKQALPSKAVSQTPTRPALAGALQRQAD